jgi:hypothetical protein
VKTPQKCFEKCVGQKRWRLSFFLGGCFTTFQTLKISITTERSSESEPLSVFYCAIEISIHLRKLYIERSSVENSNATL